MKKRVLSRERLRQIPHQFSWVDQRLVWNRHMKACSAAAWGLYLFLVVVGDAQGLSYYSDASICQWLSVAESELAQLRTELVTAEMIAYQAPLYQVLSLGAAASSARPKLSQPTTISAVLGQMLKEGKL